MSNGILEYDSKLDGEFLRSIYEDDREHAEMVFETFIQNIAQQMAELEQCYSTGDPEFFRKKIHKLKPILSYVGLTGLTIKAETIEKNCSGTKDIRDLSDQYARFKNELNEMIPVVENNLIKLKS